LLTPLDVAEFFAESCGTTIGSGASAVLTLADEDTLEILYSVGFMRSQVRQWQTIPLSIKSPITDAVKNQTIVCLDSLDAWKADYPLIPMADTIYRSWAAVPLVVKGQTIGGITFSFHEPRPFDDDERAFILALAQQCAQALDRARLYEAEQTARQDAEKAVRARDEFLSIAAHELKTPVTSLRGFAQILLRQLNKNGVVETAQLQRSLSHIDEQSNKLSWLVNALLDHSRLQAGRLTLEPKMLDLVALVTQTISTIQQTTHQHVITLDAPETLSLVGDPLRLEQVLINLLDNAVKYSPNGGSIEVRVTISAPQLVQISVRDHGLGIAPHHRDRIFDRFFQGHRDGYRGGMGLGLHISRQIVELHDGNITAEFPESGGTCFIVDLPLRRE
jgi:signal transduction histidine kinase